MNITLNKKSVHAVLPAIPSKSMAHRLLICASLADRPTEIACKARNEDIDATVRCLTALGAQITYADGVFTVTPGTAQALPCDCGESGSTLRFLLPVICALGNGGSLTMHGRLPERPIFPLREQLIAHGCTVGEQGTNPLPVSGKLTAGDYTLPGNVSSQFISGLLFALPLTGQVCTISITGKIESEPYIRMTLSALSRFGITADWQGQVITIPEGQRYRSPGVAAVEGDWSNAAFPLCAGAIAGELTLTGIGASLQGDRAILRILRKFGAQVCEQENSVTVRKAPLQAIHVDASDIPDLVPVIAVTALAAKGDTVITGAARLRIKESDRIASVCELIRRLGGSVTEHPDGMTVHGTGRLRGGTVSSWGDHRIAMSAAVASLLCNDSVTIEDAQAVAKSYPGFFEDFLKL